MTARGAGRPHQLSHSRRHSRGRHRRAAARCSGCSLGRRKGASGAFLCWRFVLAFCVLLLRQAGLEPSCVYRLACCCAWLAVAREEGQHPSTHCGVSNLPALCCPAVVLCCGAAVPGPALCGALLCRAVLPSALPCPALRCPALPCPVLFGWCAVVCVVCRDAWGGMSMDGGGQPPPPSSSGGGGRDRKHSRSSKRKGSVTAWQTGAPWALALPRLALHI
eukprot:COSAG05_NODE_1260_length_5343_cov_20.662471_6_plen_220_part_00